MATAMKNPGQMKAPADQMQIRPTRAPTPEPEGTRLAAILSMLVALMSPPAHADSWCSGVVVSSGNCESNLPPVIIRCDYDGSSGDPSCIGVGPADRHPTVERTHRKSTSSPK
jgi:hypothetical protein